MKKRVDQIDHTGRKKPFKLTMAGKEALIGYFFISLFVIGLVFVFIPAIIQSIRYSFSYVDADFNVHWVGWENYYHIFRVDPDFVRDLLSSLGGLLVDVVVIILYSLFVCTLLNRNLKGKGAIRALLFLPVVISMGCIEQYMNYTVRTGDVMSTVAETAGSSLSVEGVTEYIMSLSVSPALAEIISGAIQNIYTIISRSGVQVVVFLAGLQSINKSIYEAAEVEGCNAWETYWKITIPLLTPVITVNVVYTVIDSFTRPDNQIMNTVLEYLTKKFEYGIPTAMAWVYFLVLIAILVVVLVILKRFTYYEGE